MYFIFVNEIKYLATKQYFSLTL